MNLSIHDFDVADLNLAIVCNSSRMISPVRKQGIRPLLHFAAPLFKLFISLLSESQALWLLAYARPCQSSAVREHSPINANVRRPLFAGVGMRGEQKPVPLIIPMTPMGRRP
jgi:hypothetical protein